MADIKFEEIFGFRAPTEEETEGAAEDTQFKVDNDSSPIGTEAFFSAPGLRQVSMDFIEGTAKNFAQHHGLDELMVNEIVFAGFVAAIELMAAVRLRVSD